MSINIAHSLTTIKHSYNIERSMQANSQYEPGNGM